jgi:YhcH/YjgK/YiaL family protein
MILDLVAHASHYHALHPRIGEAFAWLADSGHRHLPTGRHVIAGEALFVMIDEGTTNEAATRRFETHRRYADIQVNLSGGERIDWIPGEFLDVEDDFAPDGDIAFHREPAHRPTSLLLMPGSFAIFWPGEAHKPVLHPFSQAVAYRKLVFKVDVGPA